MRAFELPLQRTRDALTDLPVYAAYATPADLCAASLFCKYALLYRP